MRCTGVFNVVAFSTFSSNQLETIALHEIYSNRIQATIVQDQWIFDSDLIKFFFSMWSDSRPKKKLLSYLNLFYYKHSPHSSIKLHSSNNCNQLIKCVDTNWKFTPATSSSSSLLHIEIMILNSVWFFFVFRSKFN